jgi:hypothetical protein
MALSANERRIVELVLKATGDAELKRITAELRQTREAAQSSQKALSGMSTGLSSAATFAKGFIGALGVQTVIGWGRAILEAADNLEAAAEQAGIGVERYQTLKEAFRSLEVDAKKFETGMERLASTMSDVLADDTNTATKALDELHISAKILSGEIQTTDELVDALAASQKALGNDVEFTSLMVDLFGRKLGVDFANALRDGKLATAEQTAAMSEFGVVTEAEIKKLADAQETVDQFTTHAGNAILSWSANVIEAFDVAGDNLDIFVERLIAGQNILTALGGVMAANRERDRLEAAGSGPMGVVAGQAFAAGQLVLGRVNRMMQARAAPGNDPDPDKPSGGGSSGKSAAERERELAAKRQFDINQALIEQTLDLVEAWQKADDKAAEALTAYTFAIERAADPLKALNDQLEYNRALFEDGRLSAQAWAYSFEEITGEINATKNALFEASGEFAAFEKSMADHQRRADEIGQAWEYVADAFGQATYDFVSGTASISTAIRQMVSAILAEAARIAAAKAAAWIVGLMFGSTGGIGKGGAGSVGKAVDWGSLFPKAAKGAVVNGPTLFGHSGGIGVMGEAGPEVIAPLRRDGSGNMGVGAVAPRVIVNNYAGADVGVTQTPDGVQIDIIRRAIANDIRRGGNSVSAAIEGTYRVGRGSAAFS